jgi:hypothetical protein
MSVTAANRECGHRVMAGRRGTLSPGTAKVPSERGSAASPSTETALTLSTLRVAETSHSK